MIELADGVRTRMLDTGGIGVPAVLIHGLANSVEIWLRVLPALARERRVVAFDLPGFGRADRPDAAYDGAFFARHVVALLDRLGLATVDLIGSSLGASIALHVAAERPERVRRVVLAAPGGFGHRIHPLMHVVAVPLAGPWLARPTAANNRRTLRMAMHDPRQVTPELVAITDIHASIAGSARAFSRTLRSGVGLVRAKEVAVMAARARRVECPALVIWGRQDRVFPARYAARAATLLSHSETRLIDRCGHYPHWEQPDAFVAAVTDFLA